MLTAMRRARPPREFLQWHSYTPHAAELSDLRSISDLLARYLRGFGRALTATAGEP
jgi:hypothetical protein